MTLSGWWSLVLYTPKTAPLTIVPFRLHVYSWLHTNHMECGIMDLQLFFKILSFDHFQTTDVGCS